MKKRTNKKVAAIVFIALLLLSNLLLATTTMAAHKSPLEDFATTDHGEFTRIIAYLTILGDFLQGICDDVSLHIRDYIVSNPSPTKQEVLESTSFFIRGVQAVYVFAFAATGLYMVLSSQSPKNRAKSKNLLGKLIIGFMLVTISPYILELFYGMSSSATGYIMDQGDSQIAVQQYSDVLMKTWQASSLLLGTQIAVEFGPVHSGMHGTVIPNMEKQVQADAIQEYLTNNRATIDADTQRMAQQGKTPEEIQEYVDGLTKGPAEHAKHALHEKPYFQFMEGFKMAPKPDFTFPFLMVEMMFIFLLYGLLALRYIMIMAWTILFPVTLFFTTFEPTKGLGKAMVEQTIFWTMIQVFYAVSIVVIAAGFDAMPGGFGYYGLGLNMYVMDLSLSFFTIGACIMLLLTPLFTLSLYQRLTA